MKSKTKILGTLAVLFIAVLFSVMPVSAVNDGITKIQSQNGGVPSTFSMTMTPGDNTITLAIGENLKDLNAISVTSNSAWTLKAKDQMLGTPAKPALSAGSMTQMTGTGWGALYLANKLNLGYNSGALVPISGTDTTIYTGVPEVHNSVLKMRQVVSATDAVLPITDNYQIGVYVIGAASI